MQAGKRIWLIIWARVYLWLGTDIGDKYREIVCNDPFSPGTVLLACVDVTKRVAPDAYAAAAVQLHEGMKNCRIRHIIVYFKDAVLYGTAIVLFLNLVWETRVKIGIASNPYRRPVIDEVRVIRDDNATRFTPIK